MKLVLLSGGSGKRLWPLSNDSRSKQFLKVLPKPDGEMESMVQRVWRQLRQTGLQQHAFVATGDAQKDILLSQLGGEAPLIIEPERRDTFPAIALAAVYLYTIANIGLDEVIAVLPVDPYVDEAFFKQISGMERILGQSGADMALMGVQPTYSSEKYGYIVPLDDAPECRSEEYRTVSHFKEKPAASEAAKLIRGGALWNCGVFAFRLKYMIDLLISRGLPIHYDELVRKYGKLGKISFDYEVVERAERVVVTPYKGYWKDLGTWNTLTEEIPAAIIGPGVMTDDCEETQIINELDIPVAVLGLRNVIVAASPDGILVSEKSSSPRVKEVTGHIGQQPMFVEKIWGHYTVIEHSQKQLGRNVFIHRMRVKTGQQFDERLRPGDSEIWTVLSGEGVYEVNGIARRLKEGDVVSVPGGARHSLTAISEMEILGVQYRIGLEEGDVARIGMNR